MLILVGCLSCGIIHANTIDKPNAVDSSSHHIAQTLDVDADTLARLASHPQWQQLIFYKNQRPQVISPNFYLTIQTNRERKNFSPLYELQATLKQATDPKILCRYPARYFWLNEQLHHAYYDLSQCPNLPDAHQPISFMLISSYLKNPASTFGHVLIKNHQVASESVANSTGLVSSDALMDKTYNFGAKIPPNENGMLYALKGLFGWYDAGFSETEFFKQDAVYSKNEQRDMWEYQLNLSPTQTQLLNYHLYEAKSARFNYYFIKQNCGYRSGELLELVSDLPMTQRLGGWYAPEFVFQQLANEPKLVKAVHYLPSEQTQLRQKFRQLSPAVQQVINHFIHTENFSSWQNLPPIEQKLVVDFLIAHRTYRLALKHTAHDEQIKKQLIALRFGLPTGNHLSQLTISPKIPPSQSNKTAVTELTVRPDGLSGGVTMYRKDPLNRFTDIDKRFAMIAPRFDIENIHNTHRQTEKAKLTLGEFTFLDMQQIENLAEPLAGEPKLSWQLAMGLKQDSFDQTANRPYAKGGVGIGWHTSNQLLGYAMLNAEVHDNDGHIDGMAEIGVRGKPKKSDKNLDWSMEANYQLRSRASQKPIQTTELTLRQGLSLSDDLRFIARYTDNPKDSEQKPLDWAIRLTHYW